MPAAEISARVEQAVESLDAVPLLAIALHRAGIEAPVTSALGRLIAGELPLEQGVEVVRATVPPPGPLAPPPPAGVLAPGVARAAPISTPRLGAVAPIFARTTEANPYSCAVPQVKHGVGSLASIIPS